MRNCNLCPGNLVIGEKEQSNSNCGDVSVANIITWQDCKDCIEDFIKRHEKDTEVLSLSKTKEQTSNAFYNILALGKEGVEGLCSTSNKEEATKAKDKLSLNNHNGFVYVWITMEKTTMDDLTKEVIKRIKLSAKKIR